MFFRHPVQPEFSGYYGHRQRKSIMNIRDRPFNLKGGGLWFFVEKILSEMENGHKKYFESFLCL